MDSKIQLNWYRVMVIDQKWRSETLAPGELDLPLGDLPESENGEQGPILPPKQTQVKWNDNGLTQLLALAN